ncbi:hypothetical protein NFIA_012040 [Paecilomyces variotii No. 5]|uniref:25S rRNA (Uridine(2843)-N(3))-methyltransferase n=1 Tax=Byssochlamys spectabilis (strain No. 5 / NBRC 109023) TaxID=1356009 RepID=V5HYR6_BYSSN|nr:hypothetical protein NFIA_012040 [Paecilomyces variotii No. 5]
MGPPRRAPPRKGGSSTNSKEGKKKQNTKARTTTTAEGRPRGGNHRNEKQQGNEIDLSATIPVSLQQLLLNVFKSGLLHSSRSSLSRREGLGAHDGVNSSNPEEEERENESEELDIKTLIQTIKSHLYNRDFESAFTDANEELLRAYALRWSASRALGYAGIFRAVVRSDILGFLPKQVDEKMGHVLCIGGGAGAEIVALAGVWRDMIDTERAKSGRRDEDERQQEADETNSISKAVEEMTLDEDTGKSSQDIVASSTSTVPSVSITAVDIADWSSVVDKLLTTIKSPAVPSSKDHLAPLLPSFEQDESHGGRFSVSFQKLNVLTLPDDELHGLVHRNESKTVLVTLMFTLNELFSTSMAKTTAFLLRMTDLLEPGTVLLVVDSPGSYSTVTLGKGKSSTDTSKPETASPETEKPQQRNYPMKFLLDHTLLSVAEGKWDKVLSQDSRWFRREAAKLRYAVGEGAGLEDMRFQIHIYRRTEG